MIYSRDSGFGDLAAQVHTAIDPEALLHATGVVMGVTNGGQMSPLA